MYSGKYAQRVRSAANRTKRKRFPLPCHNVNIDFKLGGYHPAFVYARIYAPYTYTESLSVAYRVYVCVCVCAFLFFKCIANTKSLAAIRAFTSKRERERETG